MAVPQRIVSLVPSLTELVWTLGAGERLVGRTRFCTEPQEMALFVPEAGGTKNPDIAQIVRLRPDLVIANKEENRREDVEALRAYGVRVVVTDPSTVAEALDMILQVGTVIGTEEPARQLYSAIREAMGEAPERPVARVFVPIWRRPLMAMGGDCYGSDVLAVAGGENVFVNAARYPEVTLDEVARRKPDCILLPDEPYRFSEPHIAEFEHIAPACVVPGQWLWWYGPRMATAIRELRRTLAEVAVR
jgi:ABC-type Fe3+-hydroxamate transport system substrate-binding protein